MNQATRIEKQLRVWPEDRNRYWVRASRRYGREIVRAEVDDFDPVRDGYVFADGDFDYPPLMTTPEDMDYVRAFPSSPVRSV